MILRTTPLLLLLTAAVAAGQSPPPVIYFSDLTSGPATGNSDSSGGRVPGRDGTTAFGTAVSLIDNNTNDPTLIPFVIPED